MSVSKRERTVAEDFRTFVEHVFKRAEEVGGDALKTRGTVGENLPKFTKPEVVPKRKDEPVQVRVAVVPKRKEEPLPHQVKKELTNAGIVAAEELATLLTEGVGGKRVNYKDWAGE